MALRRDPRGACGSSAGPLCFRWFCPAACLAWRDAGTNSYSSDPWWQVADVVSPLFFRVIRQNDTVYVVESTSGSFGEMAAYAAVAHGHGVQLCPLVQLLEQSGQPNISDLLRLEPAKDSLASQVRAVCDTLGFDGVCIDFEYPAAEDDSLFTSFLRQLSDSLPADDTLSVAVPPPNGSFTGAFQFDSLAVDSVSGVAFVLEMNYHRFPVPEDITGPTTPAWWWIDAAEMTRGYRNLAGYGLGLPTYGVDYRIDSGASDSVALRARAPESQALNDYPFGSDDVVRNIVLLSHANGNNNSANYPVQLSTATSGGIGDSCVYIPHVTGEARRQYWHTGPESFAPFLRELTRPPQINTVAVWLMSTYVDTLLYGCLQDWRSGQDPGVPLTIESVWVENDESSATNGPVDDPWTTEPDTLCLKEHIIAPETTLAMAQSDATVMTDLEWDSLRFRYLFSKPCNVRLTIVRDEDLDRTLAAGEDTVCVFRSCLQDTVERTRFDEAHWGEPWAWIAENFSWIRYGSSQPDTLFSEVVWNGQTDPIYAPPGPLNGFARRGADCDSNYIADEGRYILSLAADRFDDAGFEADTTAKLDQHNMLVVDRFAPYVKKLELWNIWPGT